MTTPLRLSAQQARVVARIREGASLEEIATQLHINRRTVAIYTERVAARLPPRYGHLRPYLAVFLWANTTVRPGVSQSHWASGPDSAVLSPDADSR